MKEIKLTHGSLFSGIEGFGLGAALAGIKTEWSCEFEDYQSLVIRKNFGEEHEINRDIRTYQSPPFVDIVSGGFPCQDISIAGKGVGIIGERSGLWTEMYRIIREIRPRYVIIENSPMLLVRGLSTSYATFPKSGMMLNGNVYRVPTLEYNRVGSDYIVLPTPTKSTANGACKNRYFGSPTYRGNIHEYIRDGEQDSQYPHPSLLENIMNFPIGWSECNV